MSFRRLKLIASPDAADDAPGDADVAAGEAVELPQLVDEFDAVVNVGVFDRVDNDTDAFVVVEDEVPLDVECAAELGDEDGVRDEPPVVLKLVVTIVEVLAEVTLLKVEGRSKVKLAKVDRGVGLIEVEVMFVV